MSLDLHKAQDFGVEGGAPWRDRLSTRTSGVTALLSLAASDRGHLLPGFRSAQALSEALLHHCSKVAGGYYCSYPASTAKFTYNTVCESNAKPGVLTHRADNTRNAVPRLHGSGTCSQQLVAPALLRLASRSGNSPYHGPTVSYTPSCLSSLIARVRAGYEALQQSRGDNNITGNLAQSCSGPSWRCLLLELVFSSFCPCFSDAISPSSSTALLFSFVFAN
jgi:hypothetical protein